MGETVGVNKYLLSLSDWAEFWELSAEEAGHFLDKNGLDTTAANGRAFLTPEVARAAMTKRGMRFRPRVLSLQMLKGGVAKTTTAMNLGIRSNMYGARVLMVDLDQQANLSFAFGVENADVPVWTDIVESKVPIEEAVIEITPTLHLIPSNLNNAVLDRVLLTGKRNIALAVSQHLEKLKSLYDLIILDTAPNLSAINTSAACAADLVLLPVNPDKFSFDGLTKTLADLKNIKAEFKARFQEKVLFTKFDGRETSSHELLKICFSNYRKLMLKSFIRTSAEMKNSVRSGGSIFAHKSSAKEDYDLVTREILGILN